MTTDAGRARRGLVRRAAWALGQLKSGKPLKATLVARQFEVSLRTAYRDLDFLRDDWHVPLEFDRQGGTFRLSEPTAFVAPVPISRGEVVALLFAEIVMRQYRGTPFEADLTSALEKIQQVMSEEISVSPEKLDAALSVDLGPVYLPDTDVFSDLLVALRQRRVALMRYRSLNSDRVSDRRVHPYHVFNHRGDWYLAAFDEVRAAIRDFAIHRVRQVTLTTDAFEIPRDFDPPRYLREAFGIEKSGKAIAIAIRFGTRQARWIRERKWHHSARVEDLIDGGCVLRMEAQGLGEVKRWVMQFGAEAEVLKPVELRREVERELDAMRAAYGRQSATRSDRRRRR